MNCEVVIIEDVSAPHRARLVPHDGRFIDFLLSEYPEGFGDAEAAVMRRGGRDRVEVDDYDFTPEAGERVFLILAPGGIETALIVSVLTKIAISLAISVALTALSALLFPAPDQPSFAQAPSPSPVYSVSVPQNSARLGQAVAVAYGRQVTVPDLAAQPYTVFEGNEQFAYSLLCIGMGEYDVPTVYAGESDLDAFDAGIADWKVYGPADHGQVHGAIEADFGIFEDMFTSLDVSGIELQARNLALAEVRAVDFIAPDTIRVYAVGDSAAHYVIGASLNVSGGAPNNGDYTIAGVTAAATHTDLNVTSGITSEAADVTSLRTFDAGQGSKTNGNQSWTLEEPGSAVSLGLSRGDVVRITAAGGINQTGIVKRYSRTTGTSDDGVTTLHIILIEDVAGDLESGAAADVEVATIDNAPTLTVGGVTTWAGWAVALRPGKAKTEELFIDLQFPGGLFRANSSTGDLEETSVEIAIQYQELDEVGAPTGSIATEALTIATTDVLTGAASADPLNTPLRLTHRITVPLGWYRVRARRVTEASDDARGQSRVVWTALRARRRVQSAPVYGNATLLAVKIKATAGLSSEAIGRIRALAHRRLSPVVAAYDPAALGLTRSPARAMYDLLVNRDYGLGLDPSRVVDIAELSAARARWDDAGLTFDHVFTDAAAAWDALRLIAQAALAEPLIVDGAVSVRQEGPKILPTQLFGPTNIVAGSFRARSAFSREGDTDGFRAVYRDTQDQSEREALFPANAVRPSELRVFGMTDPTVALDLAKVRWRQKRFAQTLLEFQTEMEGRILRRGDLIRVAMPVFDWGDAALLVSVSGTVLTVDRDLPPAVQCRFVSLRAEDGSPLTILSSTVFAATRTGARTIDVTGADAFTLRDLGGDREPTHVLFGGADDFAMQATVESVTANSAGSFSVVARAYDERVWEDTVFEGVAT